MFMIMQVKMFVISHNMHLGEFWFILQAFAGERSCYQSNFTYNGQLILLGRKGVHVLSLRPWKDVSHFITVKRILKPISTGAFSCIVQIRGFDHVALGDTSLIPTSCVI